MPPPKETGKSMLSTAAIIVTLIAALIIGLALVALKSGYLAWDRGKVGMPRLLEETDIRTNDLPALVEAMSRGTASVRYAALLFSTPDRPSDALNLQISYEDGKAGFDWVLLAPRNIEDQEKFKTSLVRAAASRSPGPKTEFHISASSVQTLLNSPPAW